MYLKENVGITIQKTSALAQGQSIRNLPVLFILHTLRSLVFATEFQPWQAASCGTQWLRGSLKCGSCICSENEGPEKVAMFQLCYMQH